MEIILGTTEFELNASTAVAIGKFDGVHLGHRRLLEEILAQKARGLQACVFTFDPAPSVLFGVSDGKELTTPEEKRAIFEKMGVDILIEFPLDFQTAAIEAEEFVRELLCGQMGMSFLAAGKDLSFGAGGAGNGALLKRMSEELDFDVKLIEKVKVDDREVSSTYIRECIEQGEMEKAEKLLGNPYGICGKVVHGNRIGRTLGFPTVNLVPAKSKLLPPNGVFYAHVLHQGRLYKGISNVGVKPTVTNEAVMGVETFLYDFDGEIYDEEIEVRLLAFERPEQRFDSLDSLKTQLQIDIQNGEKWHREKKFGD